MITPSVLFFAMLGGILPALFWLWFWLREDTLHREPRGLIAFTFFMGMVVAPFAIPIEKTISGLVTNFPFTIFLWAVTEEFLKYGAASVVALHRKTTDEAIDPVIYLITAALGFAAVENTFFLINPLLSGATGDALITGNLRFIGATLLHTVSSAIIGLFIGLSLSQNKKSQKRHLIYGLILAVILHTLFNFFIIQGNNVFIVFAVVWFGVVLLLILFEKVKQIKIPRRISFYQ